MQFSSRFLTFSKHIIATDNVYSVWWHVTSKIGSRFQKGYWPLVFFKVRTRPGKVCSLSNIYCAPRDFMPGNPIVNVQASAYLSLNNLSPLNDNIIQHRWSRRHWIYNSIP